MGIGGLGKGLGFLGAFVPGAGTLLSAVGGALVGLEDPEALTLSPYTDGTFEPEGPLWGVPQSAHEWELLQGIVPRTLNGLALGQRSPNTAAENEFLRVSRDEVLRRGARERMRGRSVVFNAGVGKPGAQWAKARVGFFRGQPIAGGNGAGAIVTVREASKIIDTWRERIAAHGDRDPVFPYIDTRPWAEWAIDEWHDTWAPPVYPFNLAAVASLPEKRLDYRDKSIAAYVANKKQPAFERWRAFNAAELARYDVERDRWRAWRQALYDDAARRQNEEQLLAEFRAVWDARLRGELTHEEALALAAAPSSTSAPVAQYAGAATSPATSSFRSQVIGAAIPLHESPPATSSFVSASESTPPARRSVPSTALLVGAALAAVGVLAWRS